LECKIERENSDIENQLLLNIADTCEKKKSSSNESIKTHKIDSNEDEEEDAFLLQVC
jgi:hypothetical protein